jgi:hypothetical protein
MQYGKTGSTEANMTKDKPDPEKEEIATTPEEEEKARWEETVREIQAMLEDEMCH